MEKSNVELSFSIDLLRVDRAEKVLLRGVQGVFIPFDSNSCVSGKTGFYLTGTAYPLREPRYGNTHCVRERKNKEYYLKHQAEELSNKVIGSARQFEAKTTEKESEK